MKKTYALLVTLYHDSQDGFLIFKGEAVIYANRTMTELCKSDLIGQTTYDVFGPGLTKMLYKKLESYDAITFKSERVADKLTDIRIAKTDDGCIAILSVKNEDEEHAVKTKFLSQTIAALSDLHRDAIMTISTAVEALKRVGHDADNKYVEVMSSSCNKAAKNIEAICEMTAQLNGNQAARPTASCDVVKTLMNVRKLSEKLIGKSVKLSLDELPSKHIIVFSPYKLECIFYGVVSAFLYKNKSTCDIKISLSQTDNKTMIKFICNDTLWEDERIAFAYKKRGEHLVEDIQKYGYDILRVTNLTEMYGGDVFVETNANSGTSVSVVLPDGNSLLHMEGPNYDAMSEITARIQLSEVISEN